MEFQLYPDQGQFYTYDQMESQTYVGGQNGMEVNLNVIDPSLLQENNMNCFHQGPPMQFKKFLGEPERNLFRIPTFQQPHIGFNKPYEAQSVFPFSTDYSGDSPCSTDSNGAFSPRPDSEMYPESSYQRQSFDASSPLSRSLSQFSHEPQDAWSGNISQAPIPQYHGGLSLSDVQVFPDPQEVTFQEATFQEAQRVAFQDDECYTYREDNKNSTIVVSTTRKSHRRPQLHLRHHPDTIIVRPLKREADDDDTYSTIAIANGDTTNEFWPSEDDDDEASAPLPVAKDDDTDPDFHPRTSKRKRAAASTSAAAARAAARAAAFPSPRKRTKANPSKSTPNGKHKCGICDSAFRDSATLTKHVSSAHTRPYVCTFAFAGCESSFGNKNEWKRHVASQHLGLRVWVCSVGNCASKGKEGETGGAKFNRKDLFTQHLRRMHAPFKVKRQNKSDVKWEAKIKDLQNQCEVAAREPPRKTRCPVVGCGVVFEGQNGWDDRMEHVGRHLEGGVAMDGEGDGDGKLVLREEADEFLMGWAKAEGIVVRRAIGAGYVFPGAAGAGEVGVEDDEDIDADGEDE